MNPDNYERGDTIEDEKISGKRRKTGIPQSNCFKIAEWLEKIKEDGADINEAIARLKTAKTSEEVDLDGDEPV